MTTVPVFLYHSVADDPPAWLAPYTVAPHTFRAQLDRIRDAGLSVVPLARLVSALHGGPALPDRSAVLTFDDGYADFYWTVAPILSDLGLPATVYLTTGAIHAPGALPGGSLLPPTPMLNWRQVATLDALGLEIGGHSRTHLPLDTAGPRRLRQEITDSKHELEDALGHRANAFAYPHGYSSRTVRREVAMAGWTSATAVADAFSSTADDPLRICRLMVRHATTPARFDDWTHLRAARTGPIRDSAATHAWRAYRRLRARLGSPVGGPPTP